jgi:GntR family transcriptional repressor for pyruvate dehydrogenase complex
MATAAPFGIPCPVVIKIGSSYEKQVYLTVARAAVGPSQSTRTDFCLSLVLTDGRIRFNVEPLYHPKESVNKKMPGTPFQPLNEKKNFERIVDLVKEKVFLGEFRPNDRLPSERELAETLRVSRLSVREAYRALELFGMVEIRRGNEGGAFIRGPSPRSIIQSVSDLFRFQGITLQEWTEARLLLEQDIGRLAIKRANEKDYARLEDLIEEAHQKIKSGTPAHEEHIRFHLGFAELSRNRILFTAYNSMMDLLLNNLKALSATLEHSRKATLAHRRIIAALKGGNIDQLSQVIEEHVRGAGKRLMAIAKGSPLFKSNFAKGENFFPEAK